MRVVGPQTTIVFCDKANGSKGCGVRPKFVRHDPAWREVLLLEQLISGSYISLPLDEEVQNLALIVHGAPKSITHDPHLIEVPVIAGPGTSTAQVSGDDGSKLQEPTSDSLVGDIQTSFGEHLLNIAEAQGEPGIQPDRMAGDFR
jgi:hypothetical protein